MYVANVDENGFKDNEYLQKVIDFAETHGFKMYTHMRKN